MIIFQIEEEVEHLVNDEVKTTYYVWIKSDDKLYSKCFSLHRTLEEAKEEIEKIKEIYPDVNVSYINMPEHYPDSIKIDKETIIDRHDNYKIKDVYCLFSNGRYMCRKENLEDIMQEAEKELNKFNNKLSKTSQIVFEVQK